MNGKTRMRSWAAVIGITLVLTATSAAEAGSRQPRPAVSSGGAACQTNRTYQQAVQAGDLPAIVAALHGGAPVPDSFLTNC